MPHDGQTHSFVAGFAEVEVDTETGKYQIVDYLAVADVGTIIHPRALAVRSSAAPCSASRMPSARSGSTISTGACPRQAFPSQQAADDSRRPEECSGPRSTSRIRNAGGREGRREPPVGAGCGDSQRLSDALGDNVIRRAPVYLDIILTSLELGGRRARPSRPRYKWGAAAYWRVLQERDMAIIRDIMPAFELFQPATTEDALGAARPLRFEKPGSWPAASIASTGSRIASSARSRRRPEPDQGTPRRQSHWTAASRSAP